LKLKFTYDGEPASLVLDDEGEWVAESGPDGVIDFFVILLFESPSVYHPSLRDRFNHLALLVKGCVEGGFAQQKFPTRFFGLRTGFAEAKLSFKAV